LAKKILCATATPEIINSILWKEKTIEHACVINY
jgi:hypothetical protein